MRLSCKLNMDGTFSSRSRVTLFPILAKFLSSDFLKIKVDNITNVVLIIFTQNPLWSKSLRYHQFSSYGRNISFVPFTVAAFYKWAHDRDLNGREVSFHRNLSGYMSRMSRSSSEQPVTCSEQAVPFPFSARALSIDCILYNAVEMNDRANISFASRYPSTLPTKRSVKSVL